MKKLSCVLLSVVLMLSISACSNEKTRLYAGACTYYADGGLMSFSEYLYKYDKNGNPVKECEYYNGELNTTIERKYDPSGSFTEKKTDFRDNAEYYYETVSVNSGNKSQFDFRDRTRKLDDRATVVY